MAEDRARHVRDVCAECGKAPTRTASSATFCLACAIDEGARHGLNQHRRVLTAPDRPASRQVMTKSSTGPAMLLALSDLFTPEQAERLTRAFHIHRARDPRGQPLLAPARLLAHAGRRPAPCR